MNTRIVWCAVVLFLFGAIASASTIVLTGNNPEPGEQNVLLNGISGPGTLITGTTNQSNTLVDFTTTNNNIVVAGPNGQSFITGAGGGNGVNGGTFSNITIALANGATFTDLIFALDLPGTGQTSACSNCVRYIVAGSASGSGNLPGTIGPGTTFFTFLAPSGQAMTSVTLSGVASQRIEDLRQVRLSGVEEAVTVSATPEPTSVLLLFSGLAFIGVRARHQKKSGAGEE